MFHIPNALHRCKQFARSLNVLLAFGRGENIHIAGQWDGIHIDVYLCEIISKFVYLSSRQLTQLINILFKHNEGGLNRLRRSHVDPGCLVDLHRGFG